MQRRVQTKGLQRMAERRRAIVLGEEVREPGKRIGDQKHRQYQPGPRHGGRSTMAATTSPQAPAACR